jgi:hypothetical protein
LSGSISLKDRMRLSTRQAAQWRYRRSVWCF